MDLYTLYLIEVNALTAANDVNIDQIVSVAYDPQTQMLIRAATLDTKFAAVLAQAHRFNVVSTGLKTLFDEAGGKFLTAALKIDADALSPGAQFWYRKRENRATFDTGNTHIKLTVASGMIIPRTLSVAVGGIASLAHDTIAIYDGTNDPVQVAVSQALTAVVPGADEFYTLGPVYLDTTEITDVQGWQLTSGLVEQVRFGGSKPTWPTYVSINARGPSLNVSVLDVALLNSLGIAGAGKEITLFLRKHENKAKTYADNTSNHIKFVINEAHVAVGSVQGAFQADATPGLVITPVEDASLNDIIAVTTDTIVTAPT